MEGDWGDDDYDDWAAPPSPVDEDVLLASDVTKQTPEMMREVLGRFLDLSEPVLLPQMEGFIGQPAVTLMLMDYIVRIDRSVPPGEAPDGDPNRQRAWHDDINMRRSYQVMNLFVATQNPDQMSLEGLLRAHFDHIVPHLLDIFWPQSDGNFMHFERIINRMLKINGRQLAEHVIEKLTCDKRLAKHVARHSHQRGVLELLEALLECRQMEPGPMMGYGAELLNVSQPQRYRLARLLVDGGLLEELAKNIKSDDAVVAERCCMGFSNILAGMGSSVQGPSLLSQPKHTTALVNGLFDVVFDLARDRNHRFRCTQCLEAIQNHILDSFAQASRALQNGASAENQAEKTNWQSLLQVFVGHLKGVADTLIELASPRASAPGIVLPSHNVANRFSAPRLALVQLLHKVVCGLWLDANSSGSLNTHRITQAFADVPPRLWKVLVDWFFEFAHNNMYQALFYKIAVCIIASNHEPVLKVFFTKTKFISRLLDKLNAEEPFDGRGFVLLFCSYLRLKQQADGTDSYVGNMLTHHHGWHEAEGLILDRIIQAFGRRLCTTGLSPTAEPSYLPQLYGRPVLGRECPWPNLFYGPDTVVSADPTPEQQADTSDSIDLGSKLALYFGFTNAVVLPQTNVPPTMTPEHAAFLMGGDDLDTIQHDPSDSGSGKKKKKKKKKKRRDGGGSGGAAGADSDSGTSTEGEATAEHDSDDDDDDASSSDTSSASADDAGPGDGAGGDAAGIKAVAGTAAASTVGESDTPSATAALGAAEGVDNVQQPKSPHAGKKKNRKKKKKAGGGGQNSNGQAADNKREATASDC